MRYVEFRDAIRDHLESHPSGASWNGMSSRLRLPYKIPCPTWVLCLQTDIGLDRSDGPPAKVWRPRAARLE